MLEDALFFLNKELTVDVLPDHLTLLLINHVTLPSHLYCVFELYRYQAVLAYKPSRFDSGHVGC
jgi:hypothetical protein